MNIHPHAREIKLGSTELIGEVRPQFIQCQLLDLANALTGTVDQLADFIKRLGVTAIEAVSQADDFAFVRFQLVQKRDKTPDRFFVVQDFIRHGRFFVCNDVLETTVFSLYEGSMN